MKVRSLSTHAATPVVLLLFLILVACEAKKSSNPLSPSVAGPIAGVDITAPRLIEPGQGFKFKENQQPIKLVIDNSNTTGVRPITYTFEVAADEGFANKVYARSGVPPGEGGRTTVVLEALELGRPYYWRVRAEDGANSSTFATAAFEMLPRAVFTVPAPTSPVNNAQVSEKRPTLHINPSQTNSAVGEVYYFFMVARDQAFTQITASQTTQNTAWTIDRDLEPNLTHYWKVRATDFEITTDWSPTQVFRAPSAPSGGGGGGGGGGSTGGPCNFGTAIQIVECERAKYGRMSRGQMLELMRNIARSLNRNGISGGPFGILRKGAGNNCGGYSCDVLCAGQGTGQRQYDVLSDIEGDQAAMWGGPNRWPDIRVDACEIQ